MPILWTRHLIERVPTMELTSTLSLAGNPALRRHSPDRDQDVASGARVGELLGKSLIRRIGYGHGSMRRARRVRGMSCVCWRQA